MDSRAFVPAAGRALALLGLGALAALWVEILGAERDEGGVSTEAPSCWLADRDAGALFGLDDALLVVRRIDLRAPLAVAPAPDGGLWALSARGARDGRVRRLLRFDAGGRKLAELPLPGGFALVALGGGGVLCLGAGPAGEALLVDERARSRPLPDSAGATCAAASGSTCAIGGANGLVRELDPAGDERRRVALPRALVALAADVPGDGWWALAGIEPQLLVRLGPQLEIRHARETECGALALAPVAGAERTWLCDPEDGLLRLEGARGVELAVVHAELADATRVLRTASGRVLVATPGALLCFDARGRGLPGQGGFDFAVDAALAKPP